MGRVFRAFRHRNYRLFFSGQAVSLIGTWIQTTAMSWLVYRMTNSTALLGLVAVVGQLPAFIVSPLAGVKLDQWDRRKLLLGTQALFLMEASILAALVYFNVVQVWHILVLSGVMGVVSAFDVPGRQAFLVEIVPEREDLGNAIALNSSQFNLARLIGPPVAGYLLSALGEATCFILNAMSFLAVLAALIAMKVAHRDPVPTPSVFQNLREGFQYAFRFPPIRSLLWLLAGVSFTAGFYSVLMPAFAAQTFHGNERTLGNLLGAVGVGALISAITLAARGSVKGLATLIVFATSVYGVGLMWFSLTSNFYIALIALVVMGYGVMTNMSATNTLLQAMVEDNMRGRVMAFYSMAFMGAMPIGSFIGGYLAGAIGPQHTTLIGGIFALIASGYFYSKLPIIREHARPVLQRKGILPGPVPRPSSGGN